MAEISSCPSDSGKIATLFPHATISRNHSRRCEATVIETASSHSVRLALEQQNETLETSHWLVVEMKEFIVVFGLCWATATSAWSQDDAMLTALIEKTKSVSKSERAAGFDGLADYWARPRRFFDVPTRTDVPTSKERFISDTDIDNIAMSIEEGLQDLEAIVRHSAVYALVRAPRSSDSIQNAVLAAIESNDSTVKIVVADYRFNNLPKIDLVIDRLLSDLSSRDFVKYYTASRLLTRYGEQARPYLTPIMDAIFDGENTGDRSSKMYSLCEIGMHEDDAGAFVSRAGRMTKSEASIATILLLNSPNAFKSYCARDPKWMELLEAQDVRLFRFLCKHQYDDNDTRDWIASAESLPANIMGMLREPRFVKEITRREANASSYERKFFEACKRACGEMAEFVIEVDANHAVEFRPASAWPNTDKSRRSNTSSLHGDGNTSVMVTGEIRDQEGSHPQEVHFYRTNDSMLMGIQTDDSVPVLYDSQSGRFVFLCKIFAAYSLGNDQPEPGPYQTGSARIRIEAPGLKPLEVSFVDEMPDLRITLEKQR